MRSAELFLIDRPVFVFNSLIQFRAALLYLAFGVDEIYLRWELYEE